MSNKIWYKKLGQNIKYYRNQKKLTQEELANLVGLSLEFIGRIEIATNKPSLETIFKIAKALDINPDQLLKLD